MDSIENLRREEMIEAVVAKKIAKRLKYRGLRLSWLDSGHHSNDESLEETQCHPLHQQHVSMLHRHDSVGRVSECSSTSSKAQRSWIESNFQKRDCIRFIPSQKFENKCGCGREAGRHSIAGLIAVSHRNPSYSSYDQQKWNVHKHTEPSPTDAYGTIEFQGAAHPTKAQYVRLSHDTRPELVLQLMLKNWRLELPKLLISVHGGIANFEIQPKLKRVFRKGLLKAAKTTGAWILTGGTNTGVMRHVGEAVVDRSVKTASKVITIGIAPWGVVDNRDGLLGRDVVRPYHAVARPKSNCAVLNSNHSFFLLVDNGTVGKYGSEILLRRRLEKYTSQQRISTRPGDQGQAVPVICVILEGGTNTIRTVLEYVTDSPPVPVVVCDGSGRAADLLAFTHKYIQEDGTMAESLRDQLLLTIEKTFQYTREQAEKLFIELMMCAKKKELITVFRMGEGPCQDIDLAILTALLKGQRASAPDQLTLALTWNRVDIARSHIFVYGQEWTEGALTQAMMDALIHDRVDFVKLLLENGVSMRDFITIPRLEELYNTKHGPWNTLRYLVRDVRKNMPEDYRYTLLDIGLLIEQLMGGAFRSSYCRRKFKTVYNAVMKRADHIAALLRRDSKFNGANKQILGHDIAYLVPDLPLVTDQVNDKDIFLYPFHDLMVWAVLMKRQKMALFMWQHGEEALAKALVARKLYKAMAKEAEQDDLEPELYDELKGYSQEFRQLAMDLLDHCYQHDDDVTEQLLTYEMKYWSEQTCLSLAVAAGCREFIAHPCCQILLTDMWMGGLRMRKYTTFWVIIGIMFPPTILTLEFKSKEELQLMPQTVEEHIWDLEDSSSASSSDDSRSEDSNDEDSDREVIGANDSTLPDHLRFLAASRDREMSFTAGSSLPTSAVTKKSPLRVGKKVYEFYTAPVTKFWLHTLAYLAFMCFYTYVVLVRLENSPSWPEIYVIAFIATSGMEIIREVISSEPSKPLQKIYVYFQDFWNALISFAVVLFLVGVGFRLVPDTMIHGRVVYCLDIILWIIMIMDIFSVDKHLGPYVRMIGKMVIDILTFAAIFFIVLMSFGVPRQSILNPYENWSWLLLRDVFMEPYFMFYGQLYPESIDPDCGNATGMPPCYPGRWITPALMTAFLLVTNILLLSLLIALFNATFQQVNKISRQLWKFERYHLIVEYEQKPLLPPPLILVSHLIIVGRYLVRRCKGKRDFFDNGLKLFLSDDDVEKLHDFEEECVEDYFREKEYKSHASTDERIKTTAERTESVSMRLDDMNAQGNNLKLSLQTVDYRLAKLEDLHLQTAELLESIHQLTAGQLAPGQLVQYGAQSSAHEEDKGRQEVESPSAGNAVLTDAQKSATPKALRRLTRSDHRVRLMGNYLQTGQPPPLFIRSNTVPTAPTEGYSGIYVGPGSTGTQQTPQRTISDVRSPLLNPRAARVIEKLRDQVTTAEHRDAGTNVVLVAQAANSDAPQVVTQDVSANIGPFMRRGSQRLSLTEHTDDYPSITDLTEPYEIESDDVPLFDPVVAPAPTALKSDYTSITDEIDTSCVLDRSPPGSPTYNPSFLNEYDESDVETKRTDFVTREVSRLRSAEESEHQQLEGVIRNRMRKISRLEGDSMSDLALMVIEELTEGQSNDHLDDPHDDDYHDISPNTDAMEIRDILENSFTS